MVTRYVIRLYLFGLILAAGFAMLLWRLWVVQIEEHKKYLAQLPQAALMIQRTAGIRGEIKDRNGIPLATNRVSYEIKLDYERVVVAVSIGMKRFATGTFVIWYPIIPRPQAHSLPRHLTNLARQADKPWLHATLRIKTGARTDGVAGEKAKPVGLVDSGVVIINPPFTLHDQLQQALPQMVQLMGQDHLAGFSLTRG